MKTLLLAASAMALMAAAAAAQEADEAAGDAAAAEETTEGTGETAAEGELAAEGTGEAAAEETTKATGETAAEGEAMAEGTGAASEGVQIGIILGFTGPLETMAPPMAEGAELAISEINEAGSLLGGSTVTVLRADSTCIDAAAATAAAEGLVDQGIDAIVGADCSGVTTAVLTNVAMPRGIGMISPSASSPGLTTTEDNGLFFRTAPSDARQGEVIAKLLRERGIGDVALTYTNNDYGKGLADSITQAFTEAGGTVSVTVPHEDGKADYSAEVASLAASGSDVLVVAGYIDQGGRGIVRNSLDTGAFENFVFPDGMIGQSIVDELGEALETSWGIKPGAEGDNVTRFQELAQEAGFDGTSIYAPESYDAAALILLAMQAAGSTDTEAWTAKVMEIANAPGEPILPGELGKALELLSAGTDIDYVGASAVELVEPGESAGTYGELEFKDGAMETVRFH